MLITKLYRRKENVVQEIVTNLSNVLNTKKGFGSFVKEMGIGDYNAYRSRDRIVETIIQEIKENIELYEPRVRLLDIKEVQIDTSFRIRFELSCVIVNHSQPLYLIFDSLPNSVSIEG